MYGPTVVMSTRVDSARSRTLTGSAQSAGHRLQLGRVATGQNDAGGGRRVLVEIVGNQPPRKSGGPQKSDVVGTVGSRHGTRCYRVARRRRVRRGFPRWPYLHACPATTRAWSGQSPGFEREAEVTPYEVPRRKRSPFGIHTEVRTPSQQFLQGHLGLKPRPAPDPVLWLR